VRLQSGLRHIEIAEKMLRELPLQFRAQPDAGAMKRHASPPGALMSALARPWETPHGRSILPSLQARFQILAVFEIGGTLLAPLLEGIEHSFAAEAPESDAVLAGCIRQEQKLLADKQITSDYILAVLQKP